MKKFLVTFVMAWLTLAATAQDSETYYRLCVSEVTAMKDKWPTMPNDQGVMEPAAAYQVSKDVQMKLAAEFMQTELCRAIIAQNDLAIGQKHQEEDKLILKREIKSIAIHGVFHADEYNVNLSRDFATKKWKLEFSFHHGIYSEEPVVDLIGFNVDGSQQLDGLNYKSAYCVIGSIAHHRYEKLVSGFEVTDSSFGRTCESPDNSDIGHIPPL